MQNSWNSYHLVGSQKRSQAFDTLTLIFFIHLQPYQVYAPLKDDTTDCKLTHHCHGLLNPPLFKAAIHKPAKHSKRKTKIHEPHATNPGSIKIPTPRSSHHSRLQLAATILDMERQTSQLILPTQSQARRFQTWKRLSPRPKSTHSFPHLQILRLTDANPWRWKQCHQFLKPELLSLPAANPMNYLSHIIPPNSETNYYRTIQQHKDPQVHKIHTTNWSLNWSTQRHLCQRILHRASCR